MVPQRVNAYAGQGQAAPTGAVTETVLGEPTSALEANIFDEVELVASISDDDTAVAKSASIQFYEKATADGADFSSWNAVGDPVVVSLEDTPAGTEAVLRKTASARLHTRQFAEKYAGAEVTITHSDASANTVEAFAALAGISQTVDPIVA